MTHTLVRRQCGSMQSVLLPLLTAVIRVHTQTREKGRKEKEEDAPLPLECLGPDAWFCHATQSENGPAVISMVVFVKEEF
ncbi:hypothetical protein BDV36DRAFT_274697 [Aspergillus pseudocaelatus]|uniref:Secreted protein n=1 Tax=Aspergillus pseudocaelatus TaxID=1825620 RepID=A0ABQ6W5S4_9EURO|nr:hypothetical protein BDV36DRAFT_274697 [Aspergillus pseudocaelatus]